MHALGEGSLVNEVRQVHHRWVLMMSVTAIVVGPAIGGIILWRYESVMGLLGWKKSDFSAHGARHQANNGGLRGGRLSHQMVNLV